MIDADTAATVSSTGDLNQRVAFVAVGLQSVDSSRPYPRDDVQTMCGGHDMAFTRAYTGSVPTGVVEFHSFRDGSDQELVGDAMGTQQMLLAIVPAVAPNEAIAAVVDCSFPEPASFGFSEATPAVFQRCGLGRHTSMVTRGKRRDIE